jgi:predicted  nucleic acid-binding Zn-ribbon protein
MAIFKKLKTALGFASEQDDLIADDPETITVAPITTHATHTEQHQQPNTNADTALKDEEATTAIFEHVVATFNKSLPDFLRQSVNPEAERTFLYNTLSDDLKKYLADIVARKEQECQESWNADKERLQENVRELEAKARNIEEKREELSQKQLSVERQKRALSDRVHDLEKQVMNYEAEREQFQLENKSLVNKLKVANVNEKDIDAMRDEITRLQEELNKARQAAITGETLVEPTPVEDHSNEITTLEEKVKSLESQLAEANENEAKANEELETLRANAGDAAALTEEFSEIEKQIEQFEQVKAKKDERISSLSAELDSAKENIISLKQTIADNLQTHAESEQRLNDEIERLKKELDGAKQSRSAELKGNERRSKSTSGQRNRLDQSSQIDDILSDTDWLVSPSSLKSNKNGQNNSTNHSTGQHRREENDAQMTLF